jgi:hypothetical protein
MGGEWYFSGEIDPGWGVEKSVYVTDFMFEMESVAISRRTTHACG